MCLSVFVRRGAHPQVGVRAAGGRVLVDVLLYRCGHVQW